jgi:hypothetical protein
MVQLGEILKAYGHFQEAALHLRHVLELRPNHQPAALILKERIPQLETSSGVFRIIIFVRAGIINSRKRGNKTSTREIDIFNRGFLVNPEPGSRSVLCFLMDLKVKLQIFYVKTKKNCNIFTFNISRKDFQAQREASSPAALQTRNFFFISFPLVSPDPLN